MPADGNGSLEQNSALLAAASWIEQLFLGSIGTSIALIAVALLGFAMLRGSFAARDGMRVVLGCFVLFGAPVIATGIVQATGAGFQFTTGLSSPSSSLQPPRKAPEFDPYAGAAVPSAQRTWP